MAAVSIQIPAFDDLSGNWHTLGEHASTTIVFLLISCEDEEIVPIR